MSETFLPIPGWVGLYEVSDRGRVWSVRSQRFLAPQRAGFGHLTVCLHRDNKQIRRRVHRLVLVTFSGREEAEVNHINHDPADNRLSNLEWSNRHHNMNHAWEHGRLVCGEATNTAKLTGAEVRKIRLLAHKGSTLTSLAKQFGVCHQHVSDIVRHKSWRHVNV